VEGTQSLQNVGVGDVRLRGGVVEHMGSLAYVAGVDKAVRTGSGGHVLPASEAVKGVYGDVTVGGESGYRDERVRGEGGVMCVISVSGAVRVSCCVVRGLYLLFLPHCVRHRDAAEVAGKALSDDGSG
jgi:hypothetical protein